MKTLVPVMAFVAVMLGSAILAWSSGFNFDQRNADVAWWVLYSAWFAGMAAALTAVMRS